MLIEASGGENGLDWLIVGFGINCDNDPPLARATSLRRLLDKRVGAAPVLAAAMKNLSRARRAGRFI